MMEEESRGSLTPTPPEVSGWVQADEKGGVVLFSGMVNQNAYSAVIHDLFPYRDGSGKRLSEEYRKVQNEIKELEGERL